MTEYKFPHPKPKDCIPVGQGFSAVIEEGVLFLQLPKIGEGHHWYMFSRALTKALVAQLQEQGK